MGPKSVLHRHWIAVPLARVLHRAKGLCLADADLEGAEFWKMSDECTSFGCAVSPSLKTDLRSASVLTGVQPRSMGDFVKLKVTFVYASGSKPLF